MKEYIERMKAVSVIKSYEFTHCPEYMQDWATKLKRAILDDLTDGMMEAPAADVEERKRGQWIEWWPPKHMVLTGEEKLFRCSACDAKYSDIDGFRFCPYCGADMREVDHG